MNKETKEAIDRLPDVTFMNVLRECALGYGPLPSQGRNKEASVQDNDSDVTIADAWGMSFTENYE